MLHMPEKLPGIAANDSALFSTNAMKGNIVLQYLYSYSTYKFIIQHPDLINNFNLQVNLLGCCRSKQSGTKTKCG